MCYGLIDGRIQLQLHKANEIICLDWVLESKQEMNVRQIESNVEALMGSWSKDTFIYELLLAYGLPKATVTRAMKGTANMSKEPGVVQLKTKVLFKPVQGQDLYVAVEQVSKQAKHKERFVIVTDFKTLLAKDMSERSRRWRRRLMSCTSITRISSLGGIGEDSCGQRESRR